jgi:hypothetical protein
MKTNGFRFGVHNCQMTYEMAAKYLLFQIHFS